MTLLCADVVGFTEMTGRLGDAGALGVMRAVAGSVRAQARRCRGEVIEIRGDSFLLAFSLPRNAVRCAIRLVRALALDPSVHGGEPVRVRMAVHTGSVIRDGGGYFGQSLILAYRLLSRVGAGNVALTPTTLEQLPERWRERAVTGGRFRPKGFGHDVRYQLLCAARFDPPAAEPAVAAVCECVSVRTHPGDRLECMRRP
jgi:adenylate cyclase